MSPSFSKTCAGSRVNRPFQSGYGSLNFTVTVLPLSEPVTDSIDLYPVSSAMLMFLSLPFRTRQVRSKSLSVIGEPSSQTAFGLILYSTVCGLVLVTLGSPTTRSVGTILPLGRKMNGLMV